jgi:GMP synthase-like glutamine amidotransferase
VKRIGILETGHNSEALTPRFGRFADAFEAWLAQHRDTHPFELDVFRVEEHEFPAHPHACDGYIVTGSAAGVYEDHDWLAPAAAFVHECIGAGGRLLGVCFGHQLLAHALGGRVEKSHRGWGLGRHTYTVRERQPWMDPELAELSLLACHQDQVVTPPAGARVLASSEFCEYAMLAVGENVITVQAHPEFSAEYAGELYESRRERFGEEATERGLATLGEPTQADVFARWALRFLCT